MIERGLFIPGFVFILLILFGLNAQAAALTQTDVEKFQFECWPNAKYNVDVKFAPVKKVSEELKAVGQWAYEFLNEEKQFSDNQINLPKKGAARVDMVLRLDALDSERSESYLWNVIVAPTVKGWRYGGHWATKEPITAYQRLSDKRQSLVAMATLSAHNDQPVHTKIPSKDVDKAGTLNKAWVDVFGEKIIDLVYRGSKGALAGDRGYSLTFYYVPTPALRLINENGYKWPSFKHVDQTGKAFGFVLTPEGECLDWSSIDIVRQ